MIILPAIDILNGECVRLYKGAYDSSKVYSNKPEEIAKSFEEAGARWIHIVDLDAARGKGKTNRNTIGKIRDAVSCSLEVGGGIRTEDDVKDLLDIGIDKLILGTILAKEPIKVAKWAGIYGSMFVGGIDALNGKVKISGWEGDASMEDSDLAGRAMKLGLCGIIYTNISKDGTLEGPDIENTNRIAEASGLPVILSGGISSEEDIKKTVENCHPGVKGIITGKAIYENRLSIEECIKKYQTSEFMDLNSEW